MQQHIYYIRYALRFADMQISELVSVFNDQVQNRGWSSMRAYHDQALIDEFQRRGIDTTAVTGCLAPCYSRSQGARHGVRLGLRAAEGIEDGGDFGGEEAAAGEGCQVRD